MRSQNATAERNWANQVMCPQCHAAPGDTCYRKDGTGARVLLVGPPAHHGRMVAANKLRQLPFDEAEQ